MTANGLSRFLVELEGPELVPIDIRGLADRSRAVTQEMRSEGAAVRFLRTIYVPEDGRCFLLFESGSHVEVGEAVDRVGLSAGGIVEAMRLGHDIRPEGSAAAPRSSRL